MRGIFLTFEGCEGCGKSTQVRLVREYLEKNNIDYVYAREPGGTVISEKIREIILDVNNKAMTNECEALLYASSRCQLIDEVIIPALNRGALVICDRYIDSSFAYQAYARKLGFDYIEKINDYVIKNCMPNYTFFLDIKPIDAFLRKGGAEKEDRLEQQGMEFHDDVYLGYKEVEKRYPERFLAIDCSGTKYETHEKIIQKMKELGVI